MTGIFRDLADWCQDRTANDVDAAGLVVVLTLDAIKHLGGIEKRGTATGDDAFFDSGAGCVERIVDAVLAFLHLDLGSSANLDDGDAAGQLGQAFLQLFLVVIAAGRINLGTDLIHARLDVVGRAGAIHDRGVVLVDGDALGFAEHAERDVFELDAEIFGDHLALRQDRDVLQHGLAAITETGRLDCRDLQAAAQLVDDQGRQRFAFDVFRNDQQRTAALHGCFQHGQHGLQVRQLLFMDQDVRIIQFHGHLVGIGDEVGRQVAAVELHAFDDIEFEFEALGLFHGDHAFLADLFHGFGDLFADFTVAIGGNDANLRDFAGTGDVLRTTLEVFDDAVHGLIDAALQVHRVHAGSDRLHAFAHDGLGQNRGGGGAVTCKIVGLAGDFAQHLRAHVLELVLEFDFLGDGDAVLGDAGCAEALVDNDVPSLGAERHLDGIGERVDALEDAFARFARKFHVLGSHDWFS